MGNKSTYIYILYAVLGVFFIFSCKKKEVKTSYIWHDETLFAQLTPFLEAKAEAMRTQDSLRKNMVATEIVVIDTSKVDTMVVYGWEGASSFALQDSVWYEHPLQMSVFKAYAMSNSRGYTIFHYHNYPLLSDTAREAMKENMPTDIYANFTQVVDSIQSQRMSYLYDKNKVKWDMYRRGAYVPGR